MNSPASDPLVRLETVGEELDSGLRAEVLALGPSAAPRLLRFIEESERCPGEPWAAVHAASLLAELKAVEAIGPMLDTLCKTTWDPLYFALSEGFPKFGELVIEPALARLEAQRGPMCLVLSRLKLRDARIFEALCAFFAEHPSHAAMCMVDYGDPAAVPLIARVIEQCDMDSSPHLVRYLPYLLEAHQRLAPAPAALRAHVRGVLEERRRRERAAIPPAVLRLETEGQTLGAKLRGEVLALGAAAIPGLIRVLEGDAEAKGPKIWAPLHAVELLVELNATEAIDSMLEELLLTDWDDLLHDRIVQRLPKLGAPVLEPALELLDDDLSAEQRESICTVISNLEVRDPRIFELLTQFFEEDPEFAAMCLGDYGDPAALPLLAKAIEEHAPDFTSKFAHVALSTYVEAYEQIAPLTPQLRERVEVLEAQFAAHRAATTPARRPANQVGRNDPCPCGSGQKFKKCCMGKTAA